MPYKHFHSNFSTVTCTCIYTVLVKKRLRIGRDSSQLLREDKIANPSRLYYREVREQCKYLCTYVRPPYIVRIS